MAERQDLVHRLYFDEVYIAAARIIGYLGCSPFEFFDRAKQLPIYNQPKFDAAMRALTDFRRREQGDPRYELASHVRKHCRQLLGPPPEEWDAFYTNVTNPPPNPYATPKKKRKPLTRKKK